MLAEKDGFALWKHRLPNRKGLRDEACHQPQRSGERLPLLRKEEPEQEVSAFSSYEQQQVMYPENPGYIGPIL
jgi:hypothetical protein